MTSCALVCDRGVQHIRIVAFFIFDIWPCLCYLTRSVCLPKELTFVWFVECPMWVTFDINNYWLLI